MTTPNVVFGGNGSINATGASTVNVTPGASGSNYNLTIQGNGSDTLSTNGGLLNVSAQDSGVGAVTFASTGNTPSCINLNAGGNKGSAVVALSHGDHDSAASNGRKQQSDHYKHVDGAAESDIHVKRHVGNDIV